MKLRLLRLDIRPVFVLDDGDTLTENVGEPFSITEAGIATFPEKWAADFETLRKQVESEPPSTPNRATRRAAVKSNGNGKAKTTA